MGLLLSWCCVAILAALTRETSASQAHPRLRETKLDMELLGRKLPVDPVGSDGPNRVAGYFALNRTEAAEMFYFLFESRKDPKTAPVVLWMTGGPGCGSELALFNEHGPFKINDDLTLDENPYGWDVSHNVIYVDQPIGSGYSYSTDPADTVYSEAGVAADMLDFLRAFLDAYPEFAENGLYITGESYGGHYVPAVAYEVWKYNRGGTGKRINFKGFAIGNGITDPAIQYGSYADYALLNGIIPQDRRDEIQSYYPRCKELIEECNSIGGYRLCRKARAYCVSKLFVSILWYSDNINDYDIRKKCTGSLCYDMSLMSKYLAQDTVRKALGVEERPPWKMCNFDIYDNFAADYMLNSAVVIPEMLEDGIRVMVYVGEMDLKWNWVGVRRWVDALPWSGAAEWADAEDCEWQVGGKRAGRIRQSGLLSFVRVYDAGHLVPMDQPEAALDLLQHLTAGKAFDCAEAAEDTPLQLTQAAVLLRNTISGDGQT